MIDPGKKRNCLFGLCSALLLLGMLSGCATREEIRQAAIWPRDAPKNSTQSYRSDSDLWTSNHPRVVSFRKHYAKTKTVNKALENGQRYLPAIRRIFRKKKLPQELAYLPMLESLFYNRADSGSARGMWQFTKQTARHMGLKVSKRRDERLNWYKATLAAAEYLDELGRRFNYDWALALAAYNGGPNYVQKAIDKQKRLSFWNLKLRQETYEYVPRFIAMLQVAREHHKEYLAMR